MRAYVLELKHFRSDSYSVDPFLGKHGISCGYNTGKPHVTASTFLHSGRSREFHPLNGRFVSRFTHTLERLGT